MTSQGGGWQRGASEFACHEGNCDHQRARRGQGQVIRGPWIACVDVTETTPRPRDLLLNPRYDNSLDIRVKNMGHHYIPQHYLRGFEVSGQPGMIWMYNKTAKTSKFLPIKSVRRDY